MQVDGHAHGLLARALALEDPEQGLLAVACLRRRLATLERIHVRNARESGYSWSRLAQLVGVSKQALHKKHAAWIGERPGERPPAARTAAQVVVTAEARRAVRYAREEARARGHFPVGTVHLLLGLLRDPSSSAGRALARSGVTPAGVRVELDRLLEALARPAAADGRLPVSRAARRALEQSLHESVRLGDGHLGVEHVLLAVLRQESAPVARVLAALGTSPGAVEERLLAELGRKPKGAGTSDAARNLVA